MKKKLALTALLLFSIVLIIFSQSGLLPSVGSLFKARVVDDRTASEKEAAAALKALESQRADEIVARDARENERKTAEGQLKNSQKALRDAEARGASKAEIDDLKESVSTDQESYNMTKASLDAVNEKVSEVSGRIESSPEMRKQRLLEYYNDIISANEEKGKAIDAKKAELPEEQKIIVQQSAANKAYTAFLKAKRDLEYCEVDDPACPELQIKQAARDEASRALRALISDLTHAEEEINKGMQFPVSDIFKPVGQTAKKLTLMEVTNKIADWMIMLVSSLAVTALIIGGFMMIISGGDETRLETGKTIFTYSLIGLGVTLLAYGIIATIQSLFY